MTTLTMTWWTDRRVRWSVLVAAVLLLTYVELLWIARQLGYRVAEVPVIWINDPSSRVHPLRDSLRMVVDLMRLRYNDLRGVYRPSDDLSD